MVSLRRRKLLGFCSGISSSKVELPRYNDNSNASENPIQCSKSITVHPIPSMDIKQPVEINNLKPCPASSNLSGTSSSKEAQEQRFFGHEVKRRKRHRRKHFDNHEPCIMRGVYFKNMKWQAAIKVDKKQIHLGTVGTQEEAAHLYDRAAFMCGREPNFELSEEVKRELRQLKWDDFLEITRQTITNKKHERRLRAGSQKTEETPVQNGTWVTGFSATVLEPDVSAP